MYIVTAKEMYNIDRFAEQEIGIDGRILMENAGRAATEKIKNVVTKTDRISIFVGSGNNGGDGFVIARTLHNENYDVKVVQVAPGEKITGNVLYNKQLFLTCGGSVVTTTDVSKIEAIVAESDVIIDAIIGIGVHGLLREPLAAIVSLINEKAKRVIAIDIPSGLPADQGVDGFSAVQADHTIIIEAPKVSLFLQHTAPFYGEWEVVSIGIPIQAMEGMLKRRIWDIEDFQKSMPKRKTHAHKGDHGRGLAVGGSAEMPGSIAMTARAALRAGAGLITVATSETVIPAIASTSVEAVYSAWDKNGHEKSDISLDPYDAVAIGMGMGRSKKAEQQVLSVIANARCPVIIDADGLYHAKRDLAVLKNRSTPTIITPHPGEMATLLDITVAELLQRPFDYSAKFASEYEAYVVLKGKHTIITAPDQTQAVNITGNQGLAKAGSGDVLSGITLAMVMQESTIFEALCNACFVHGMAANLLVADKHSYYDLLATDVVDGIPSVYRTFL